MDKRQKIQEEALTAWLSNKKKGTLELITGLGKTKIALDAVKPYPKGAKILFLAETTGRELELENEQQKWGLLGYDIKFACYQSAYKWKDTEWDLVIADEIHDSLTQQYSKFYTNNKYKAIMGLSATIDRKAIVNEEEQVFKGNLLDKIAPVCYTYGINEGQEDGTSRKLDVYVINHKLDIIAKTITSGSKLKPFMQTEWGAYNYWDSAFRKALYAPESIKQYRIRYTSNKRADLLYQLPSKVSACKKLIDCIPGKTIIFGNSLEALHKITDNVVSSKNSDAANKVIREDFDTGKTKVIASFKKLKQGANLVDLDNCIIHSYYSKSKDLIQRIGRLRNNGEIGRVFIFVTFGTQEVKWYNMMFEDVESLNLNYCHDVDDCLSKLN
tara:strand:+ start:17294 stop:18448 length:1155 start_codon:yes stop_codon:yes gene_type:complete